MRRLSCRRTKSTAALCTITTILILLVFSTFVAHVNHELILTKLDDEALNITAQTFTNYDLELTPSAQAFRQRVSQITKDKPPKQFAEFIQSWKDRNVGFTYTLFTDEKALEFVKRIFSSTRPDVYDVYRLLHQRVIAADLLRYLIMYEVGGIYSDIDTECTRPVKDWNLPKNQATYNLVVGLEADEQDATTFDDTMMQKFRLVSRLQMTQWTLMAKPRHPVMARAIDKIVGAVIEKVNREQMPISSLYFSQAEILQLSGPGMYTECVKAHLRHILKREISDSELSTSSYNHVIADVLILPVNAFAPGQRHSKSGDSRDSMVYHGFSGSWRSRLPGWTRFLGIT